MALEMKAPTISGRKRSLARAAYRITTIIVFCSARAAGTKNNTDFPPAVRITITKNFEG
jgi:hypothetical protein